MSKKFFEESGVYLSRYVGAGGVPKVQVTVATTNMGGYEPQELTRFLAQMSIAIMEEFKEKDEPAGNRPQGN